MFCLLCWCDVLFGMDGGELRWNWRVEVGEEQESLVSMVRMESVADSKSC